MIQRGSDLNGTPGQFEEETRTTKVARGMCDLQVGISFNTVENRLALTNLQDRACEMRFGKTHLPSLPAA